ncbi:MAG: fructosamine kinase family protein [Actinomycetota bacterium]
MTGEAQDVAEVERALDVEIVAHARVTGGDVAEAYRLQAASGVQLFAKTRRGAPPDFFDTEARGLRWLREAEAMPVPAVVHVSTEPPILVLEWVDETHRRPVSDVAFGRDLARLHQAGSASFGREDGRPTGSRGLPNDPCSTWSEFYAMRRLLPLARMARDGGALDGSTVTMIETVAGRLDEFEGADEAPARLHGDLWAGNRIVDAQGQSWLIDPAAHGGHREFDLAMMALFGGWAPDVFDAYDEAWSLADGWRDRVALHQLAPLAVHAIKFGGSYGAATAAAVRRYV